MKNAVTRALIQVTSFCHLNLGAQVAGSTHEHDWERFEMDLHELLRLFRHLSQLRGELLAQVLHSRELGHSGRREGGWAPSAVSPPRLPGPGNSWGL